MTQYSVLTNNIIAIGYDEIKEILEIEFKLKVKHHYFNVPLDEFVSLMKAEDIEEFYFHFIQCSYHFDVF